MARMRRLALVGAGLALAIAGFSACGSDDKDEKKDTSTGGGALTFADVSTILSSNCGGCHASGAANAASYTTTEADTQAKKAKIREVINATDASKMPPDPATLRAADKERLETYLAQ